MPVRVSDKLVNWASDVEPETTAQALKTSRLPIVAGHVALMPDAHVGLGATVGSVIPTENAVIPAAVGVDIGCGMVAVATSLTASQLPDDLDRFLPVVERVVPAGLGRQHDSPSAPARQWFRDHPPPHDLGDLERRALEQFGSLGSGNHFFEICLDEGDQVWVVLHSGSRGVGNKLATKHIGKAKSLARSLDQSLEDPDLAWFTQGTPEFQHYVDDLLWCQAYARANRDQMMDAALAAFFGFVGAGEERRRVNCHHNFTQQERHGDRVLWITRKGAIKADVGDEGVIPGSMGTCSYIVRGKGNPLAYRSCAHGAGRRLSRSKARRTFTVDDMARQMTGKVWQRQEAEALLDEIPASYKDIDQVMEDQRDLVEVVHTLGQVLNYKGTDAGPRRRRRR